MGFRFRKSIKIAPGVRINLGKKGVSSVSVGGRGLTLNTGGKQGTRITAGLPGTGLSYSETLSRPASTPAAAPHATHTLLDEPGQGISIATLLIWVVLAFLAGALLF